MGRGAERHRPVDGHHVPEVGDARLALAAIAAEAWGHPSEQLTLVGITELNEGRTPKTVKVKAGSVEFDAVVRIDTPGEANYYRNGGIMPYVLRSLRG